MARSTPPSPPVYIVVHGFCTNGVVQVRVFRFGDVGCDEVFLCWTVVSFDSSSQMRAKALGDDQSLETAISFILDNFDTCMTLPRAVNKLVAESDQGGEDIPACLKHDDSPAVDLLLALAKRYVDAVGKRPSLLSSPSLLVSLVSYLSSLLVTWLTYRCL